MLGDDPRPPLEGEFVSEFDDPLRAEVRSTDRSFAFPLGAEVGQPDASCGGRQLAEVKETSEDAPSMRSPCW